MSEEKAEIKINKPTESDWKDMSDEWGWDKNEYLLDTPIGEYVVGKRNRKNGVALWWFSDNKLYRYATKGREYPTKSEAMKAAWEHYKEVIQSHSF